MAELVYAKDLKSFGRKTLWVQLPLRAPDYLKSNLKNLPPIAQLVEQSPLKRTVLGSSPSGRT